MRKKRIVAYAHRQTLRIHAAVINDILNTIGKQRAETGGPLGGKDDVVSHFHFDRNSRRTAVTYSPNIDEVNRMFKAEWNPGGIRLRGFVHSHPGGMATPSSGDCVYAREILRAIPDLPFLWLPIVSTIPETGRFALTPWLAVMDGSQCVVKRADLEVIQSDVAHKTNPESGRHIIPCPTEVWSAGRDYLTIEIGDKERRGVETAFEPSAMKPDLGAFERVRSAYDLGLMETSRVVGAGTGGAAEWYESMARAGVGQFVLIDHDTVGMTNLATQQTYRRDIGRSKVECIAERILDINPDAIVEPISRSLDALTDDDLRRLCKGPLKSHSATQTVLCGLTDNFFAQARINRLALTIGVPSLCAQVYREGRGAEITFTYPGVTPACHRCILSSRYRHFLNAGGDNEVTSHGTPIFSTSRLNALKGFICLALLHHNSSHPRWGGMLSRVANRNLVQIRMDPDFADTLGIRVFDRVFATADRERLFFDEVVWLPQEPECERTGHQVCPDCGGTGDLRDAIGQIANTRVSSPHSMVSRGA